jgi:hypothetical protein
VQPAHRHRGQRAQVELALGADVEQPRAEGHRRRQAGEDQRRGARQRLGQRKARAEAALQQQRVGLAHRRAGPGHQQRTDSQRDDDGHQRRQQQQRARRRDAQLKRSMRGPPEAIGQPDGQASVHVQSPGRAPPQAAVVHDGDAVGQREDLVQVFADQQHALPAAAASSSCWCT